MSEGKRIGIVGATGAVGRELMELLEARDFPVAELRLLASARSVGKELTFRGESIAIKEARPEEFAGLDYLFLSAGGDRSLAMAPAAVEAGAVVIDNSSAFRMDDEVPLVVPEVNPEALLNHKGIIANPNCSTAITLMGVAPLHQRFGLKRMICSTYQAVSGAGATGITELEDGVRAWSEGKDANPSTFPHPIAFNLIPHVDKFLESGYTKEEVKMRNESRKILSLPSLPVSCTCVRVPVFRAHAISIFAEFEKPVDVAEARAAVAAFDGAELVDDPTNLEYPMPLGYSSKVACGVGRIRRDEALENGLAFWVVGDQLWKGAALNALQIAEHLVR
ncbi:aspartate-semialdehyde dehydrogenase [Puniceicoccus vermicola]|uniref:Aspartate-semialdehyde dehydrogenase n=1 Tax=Puniceicoccus vermicola TaxID=388746 RepID=A0A7X1B0U8_9BACT|nr:aspartate-semialdehyde dehydrogenase [Puniceicoccus vermicola]MBC2602400.1 aspartate-semialdehyde dehydrogenase [Puniceicoccus vermicola]